LLAFSRLAQSRLDPLGGGTSRRFFASRRGTRNPMSPISWRRGCYRKNPQTLSPAFHAMPWPLFGARGQRVKGHPLYAHVAGQSFRPIRKNSSGGVQIGTVWGRGSKP